ncbi:hypothetical protein ACQ4LE_007295 [Meloidogyne hapla]
MKKRLEKMNKKLNKRNLLDLKKIEEINSVNEILELLMILFSEQNVQTDDTFTEKLVAQVIKNLQIRIKRVHLRYEDKFSNRGRPFATGVTLDSLNFQVHF